jgi:TusA-related sulfurtransferase
MATMTLDALGLKCLQLLLKIASTTAHLKEGEVLEILADCPTFEKDVRKWCERTKRTILWIRDEGAGTKRCQIQF